MLLINRKHKTNMILTQFWGKKSEMIRHIHTRKCVEKKIFCFGFGTIWMNFAVLIYEL